jgi:hypothetical protein
MEARRLGGGGCGGQMLRCRRAARWRRSAVERFLLEGEPVDGAVASGDAAFVRLDALTRALPNKDYT